MVSESMAQLGNERNLLKKKERQRILPFLSRRLNKVGIQKHGHEGPALQLTTSAVLKLVAQGFEEPPSTDNRNLFTCRGFFRKLVRPFFPWGGGLLITTNINICINILIFSYFYCYGVLPYQGFHCKGKVPGPRTSAEPRQEGVAAWQQTWPPEAHGIILIIIMIIKLTKILIIIRITIIVPTTILGIIIMIIRIRSLLCLR